MNDLVIIKPKMPVAAKHQESLKPFFEDDGVMVTQKVTHFTDLIPINDCDLIISELKAALVPCENRDATLLAAHLIGPYRVKDVISPEIYTRTIAEMFALFPLDIGERVRLDVVGRVKWVPMPAEVKESGDQMMLERNGALYTAKKHRDEHYRRKAMKAKQVKSDDERGDYLVELKQKYIDAGMEYPGDGKASVTDFYNFNTAEKGRGA